jgi:predicted DsbA family dithiol-disulfide isomerase
MGEAAPAQPQVIIFSDYICPFCYIGKVTIDQLQREFAMPVEWRYIEIHPEYPLEGIPRAQLGVGYYSQAWLHVERMAAERGIEMRPSPILANSSLALIATEYARLRDRFLPFHEAVYRAYWLDGQNIGELRVLLTLAQQVGLDPGGLKAYFQEGNWEQALEAQQRSAAAYHVSGVPTVVIGDEVIVGAQPYDVFRDAVLKARGEAPRGHQPVLLDLQTTAEPISKERADPAAK